MATRLISYEVCDPCDEDGIETTEGLEEHTIKLDGLRARKGTFCPRHVETLIEPVRAFVQKLPAVKQQAPARSATKEAKEAKRTSEDARATNRRIREWAAEENLQVPPRGRIPAAIREQFEQERG